MQISQKGVKTAHSLVKSWGQFDRNLRENGASCTPCAGFSRRLGCIEHYGLTSVDKGLRRFRPMDIMREGCQHMKVKRTLLELFRQKPLSNRDLSGLA